ncbi:MAG: hypothetical protein K2M11_00975 [Paramuribaculum sp.]|nr:hypothetical protein [Paramuribaculum sp.]
MKNFAFKTAWYEIIKDCTVEVKGQVFSAVMEYVMYGTLPELTGEAEIIFAFIKFDIDERADRREKRHEKNLTKQKEAATDPEAAKPSEMSANEKRTTTYLPNEKPYKGNNRASKHAQRTELIKNFQPAHLTPPL